MRSIYCKLFYIQNLLNNKLNVFVVHVDLLSCFEASHLKQEKMVEDESLAIYLSGGALELILKTDCHKVK